MRKVVHFASVAAALLLGSARVRAQDVGLEIGTTPKAVVLEDLDGKAVDLAQYIGRKPVVIEFWATWCPLCKELEPQLNAARQRFGGKVEFLVVAVGVSQTPRSIKRHIAQHPQAGRVLWDGKGAAVRAFMAPSTSYVVVLDATGKVVYTGTGAEQKLTPVLARL